MYKTRNIVDTYGRNMVRIEKREHILGIAIAAGHLQPSEMFPGMTEMQVYTMSQYDLLDWEVKLIEETG